MISWFLSRPNRPSIARPTLFQLGPSSLGLSSVLSHKWIQLCFINNCFDGTFLKPAIPLSSQMHLLTCHFFHPKLSAVEILHSPGLFLRRKHLVFKTSHEQLSTDDYEIIPSIRFISFSLKDFLFHTYLLLQIQLVPDSLSIFPPISDNSMMRDSNQKSFHYLFTHSSPLFLISNQSLTSVHLQKKIRFDPLLCISTTVHPVWAFILLLLNFTVCTDSFEVSLEFMNLFFPRKI